MSTDFHANTAAHGHPDFVIRAAQPQDVGELLRMIRALAAFERLEHLVEATPELLERHLFGPKPVVEAVLVWPSGAELPTAGALGFALYFHNFSTFLGRPGLYLEDLYVEPASRGLGVGRALLEHLASLAVQRGCGRFEWAVLDWNERAIGFYENQGATVMSDWRICRVTGAPLQALAQARPK